MGLWRSPKWPSFRREKCFTFSNIFNFLIILSLKRKQGPIFIGKDCSSKFCSKHNTVLLLSLLRNLLEQSLPMKIGLSYLLRERMIKKLKMLSPEAWPLWRSPEAQILNSPTSIGSQITSFHIK